MAGVVTLLLGAAAPVAGAAGWVQLGGTPAAATGVAGSPTSLAIDPAGDVWLAFVDASSGAGTGEQVLERAPGGSFTARLDLPQSVAHPPVIAAGSDGTVAVAWDTGPVGSGVPHVAIRPPGGTFGTPVDAPAGQESGVAGLAVLPNGTVLLAWSDDTAPDVHVEAIAPSGALVDETPAGIGQLPNDVRLVSNATGEAVLAWDDGLAGGKARIAFSERPPGGTFGATGSVATRNLQAGESSQRYRLGRVALDDAGDLALAANLGVDSSGTLTESVRTELRPAGQATFAHATLDSTTGSPSTVFVFAPTVVLDSARRAVAVWVNSAKQVVAASTTPAGTTFSPSSAFTSATPGSCGAGADTPLIAPLAGGGLAGLMSNEAFPPLCFGGPLVPLSPAGAGGIAVSAQPAIEPTGAWTGALVPDRSGDAFAAVSFSPDAAPVPVVAYDATPPTIGAIAVPASLAAGSPASLSVPAGDAISGVSVSWSFGDGGSGSGTGVSHTWAVPGAYTVTATATDGADNSTATSTLVVVADRTAPVIGGASLTHRSFAVGAGRTAISARKHRPARGTTIRFMLSELADVKLTISHKIAGRRVGKRCVATRGRGTAHKRCKVTKSDGALTRRALAAGPNRVSFSGRIGRRRLKAGEYQLRIDATDAAGNQATARMLRFRIVKA
jgi:hypothetical protein